MHKSILLSHCKALKEENTTNEGDVHHCHKHGVRLEHLSVCLTEPCDPGGLEGRDDWGLTTQRDGQGEGEVMEKRER